MRISMTTVRSPATRARLPAIVWPLAVAETIVWAAMYYAFPALLTEWERDLGWSRTELSAAFTLSILVSAAFVPVAGRLIDRGFASTVFTGGAVLGAALLALLSTVTEVWQFYCVWIGLGVAMSSTLYDACFTVLVRSAGDRARRAITVVTLFAGFAGTVAFPSAHVLAGAFGWRGAVLVFAAAVAGVAAPLIHGACRRAEAEAHATAPTPASSADTAQALAVARTATFWLLGAAAFLIALDHGMLVSHVLPILGDRGIDAGAAVVAASFIGPMQVAGRLALMASDRFAGTLTATAGCFAMMALAGVCLLGAGAAPALVVGFVVLQGAGIGIASVMRPVVTAELFGRRNFGVVSGLIGLMHMSGYALGPTVSALVWAWGGYGRVIALATAVSVAAVAALVMAWRAGTRENARVSRGDARTPAPRSRDRGSR